MSQTLGQLRVGADFNPSKNERVDQIKNKAAELIDLCESMRQENGDLSSQANVNKQRWISEAQTLFETRSMFAVKENFAK